LSNAKGPPFKRWALIKFWEKAGLLFHEIRDIAGEASAFALQIGAVAGEILEITPDARVKPRYILGV